MTWEMPTTILPSPAEPVDSLPPRAPRLSPRAPRLRVRPNVQAAVAATAMIALLLGVVVALDNRSLHHSVSDLKRTVAADQRTQRQLQSQVGALLAGQQGLQSSVNKASANTINAAVSAKVLKSVFTVEAGNSLGTAFAVRRTATGGTVLVTNYHVLAGVWTAGVRSVKLKQGARSMSGQIQTVRPSKDLASIEVVQALPLLPLDVTVPPVGAPVLVVGSPLGLGGTVTTGVVSAHRTGLIQISAPISPGNSGGPVVDAAGRAVGIASEKIVSNHAEGLGFAIPIREVCSALVRC